MILKYYISRVNKLLKKSNKFYSVYKVILIRFECYLWNYYLIDFLEWLEIYWYKIKNR